MNEIKLDVRDDYLDIKIIQSYIERWNLGLEDTNRTLPEFLADEYELQRFYLDVDTEYIMDLEILLREIYKNGNISVEMKSEIKNVMREF